MWSKENSGYKVHYFCVVFLLERTKPGASGAIKKSEREKTEN